MCNQFFIINHNFCTSASQSSFATVHFQKDIIRNPLTKTFKISPNFINNFSSSSQWVFHSFPLISTTFSCHSALWDIKNGVILLIPQMSICITSTFSLALLTFTSSKKITLVQYFSFDSFHGKRPLGFPNNIIKFFRCLFPNAHPLETTRVNINI